MYWTTVIYAKRNPDGEIRKFGGPNIQAPTRKKADQYCIEKLGHCFVQDKLVSEIGCKKGTLEPDWNTEVNYDHITDN